MHFRLPGRPLADELRLLYDNSVADMLKIVTEHNFVELYTEHKIVRDIYGIAHASEGICDLIVEKLNVEGTTGERAGGNAGERCETDRGEFEEPNWGNEVCTEVEEQIEDEARDSDEEVIECDGMSDDDEE